MRRAYLAAAICALGLSLLPCAADARHSRRAHHARRDRFPVVRRTDPPGVGMALDPATGNYRISYYPPALPPPSSPSLMEGQPAATQAGPVVLRVSAVSRRRPSAAKPKLLHAIFVPATKIDPIVESDFVYRPGRREVQYAYRIANGRGAKQALVRIAIEPLSTVSALMLPLPGGAGRDAERTAQFEATASGALISPDHWSGTLSALAGPGLRIVWQLDAAPGARGVAPGRAQSGFGLPADDLPGVALARLRGNAPPLRFGGHWPPGDIGDRLRYLTAHDYVTRPVAVPAITLPDPYDSAALIGRIQAQMHTWIALGLLDPLFADRLDHHLEYAADELRNGWTRDARYDLDAVHLLLALQYPSLEGKAGPAHLLKPAAMQIDVVAARVLDFDLKYVEMRMDQAH